MIHLGIIPDGNRRWSRQHGIPVSDLVIKLFGMIKKTYTELSNSELSNLKNINSISIYLLSKDNLTKRKDDTMEMIRNGLKLVLEDLTVNKIIPWQYMKVQFVGELHLLPKDVFDMCKRIESLCGSESQDFVVTAGIGYDPIEDSRKVLTNNSMRPFQRPIDMVIRTGGEIRSSGFYPLHTLYAEWFYMKKLIPDLTFKDIDQCIESYLQRERRYGA